MTNLTYNTNYNYKNNNSGTIPHFLESFLTPKNFDFALKASHFPSINPNKNVSDTHFEDINLEQDDIKPIIKKPENSKFLNIAFTKIKKIYENIKPLVIDFTIKSKEQVDLIKKNINIFR
jgi:hypothetical protein